MNAQKKLGKKGTLTIPQQLRHQLGLQGGAALDITTTEDGGLLLQKHLPACNICGGTQGVVKFKGFDICRECRQGLREVAGDD